MSTKKPRSRPLRRNFRRLERANTPSSSPARDEPSRRQKVAAIKGALEADPVDVKTLRQLAISRGGLLCDELRRKAWPKLLSIDVDNIPKKPDEEVLHSHRDYQQVVLDVNRSLKRFPPGMAEERRMAMQDQLVDVIMWVLVENPELHYYQGYHDITVTFLLVVGEDITFAIMDELSKNHLRDFMDKTMDRTRYMLHYLYPIMGLANSELRAYMEKSEVGTIFCLSWLITWYGHVLNEFCHIVRLYDFFIACHPLMPIYLAAAIVLYRQKEVLSCESEMCIIHSLLSKIPDDLPLEKLVIQAGDLYVQYHPDQLAEEAKSLHEASVAALQNQKEQLERNRKLMQARKNTKTRGPSMFMKVTVWTLTAAIGAVAFAALKSITEWQWGT